MPWPLPSYWDPIFKHEKQNFSLKPQWRLSITRQSGIWLITNSKEDGPPETPFPCTTQLNISIVLLEYRLLSRSPLPTASLFADYKHVLSLFNQELSCLHRFLLFWVNPIRNLADSFLWKVSVLLIESSKSTPTTIHKHSHKCIMQKWKGRKIEIILVAKLHQLQSPVLTSPWTSKVILHLKGF